MKRPFAHIGFSIAITLIILNIIDFSYLPIILIGLAVIFAASLVFSKFRNAIAIPLCLASAIFGCLIFAFTYTADVNKQFELDNQIYNTEFYIVDLEENNGNNYTYTVKTRKIEAQNAPQNIKLKLKTKTKIDADYYQVIRGKLKFSKISDNAFDSYGKWADNIYLKANCYDNNLTDEYVKSINKYVLQIRQNIIDTINSSLNGDVGGLATALLIGDKSNLSKNTYNNFKIAGVTHIMAVSGLHLVVLSSMFILLLKVFRVNQRVRASIVIPLVLFYIALAGFSKSVIRAGIIMLVLLIGELFKRKGDSLNSLGLAVTILCFNPFCVCDVGAILSVLSTLSLITLYPKFDRKIIGSKILNKPIVRNIVKSIAISLCVMLYTLPVLYLFFGYISIAGIISNIILVPIASLAMVSSLLLYLSSFVNFIHPLFVMLSNSVISLMIWIVEHISKIHYAIVPLSDYMYIIIAAVLFIIGIAFITNKKNNIKCSLLISTITIMLTLLTTMTMNNSCDKLLICKNNSVLIQNKSKVAVVNLDNYEDYYTIYNYIFVNNLEFDTIVLNGDYNQNKYNIMLCQKIKPNNIVSYGDMQTLYDMPKSSVIDFNYDEISFCDNVKYKSFEENGNYFSVKLDNFTISNSKYNNSDIKVLGKYVKDCNGYIDLSQSNVVYCLNDDSFTVRRVD